MLDEHTVLPTEVNPLLLAREEITSALKSHNSRSTTLWFALDEAALWQDQEAARYGQADAGPPEQ
ncbi:MAG TPA: hypothetical protein VFW65_14435 [Pseudonocardiaceae bacterium]|nr:hypothetical protein [Pseudonocardiaceae bacterium]